MLDVTKLIGEVVHGQYCITDYISEGSFGWVFKAEQMVLGQNAGPIAVKILKDDLDEEDAVLREVLYQKECGHPHVIEVRESGRNHAEGPLERQFFIVMELADESLEARLKRGPLTSDEARKVASDVCAGLAHLHGRQVVHRDLKPANILCVDGVWKLSDFGLARLAGHLRTQSRLGGTPDYSPPEGLGNELVPSFDMWSFGCVLHKCLTGELPTIARDGKVKLDRTLAAPFKTIVSTCLKQDPERRLTAADCLKRLDPSATPIHSRVDDGDDCFLCDGSAGIDCARRVLTGTVARIKKVSDGFECLIHSAEDLEGIPLLLSETWARELGERLHAEWAVFSRRPHPVTLSAFHLVARIGGFRATDDSLVVLDPDWLVRVTDLRDVHGCERVRLVGRYEVFKQNRYVVLGNVVNDLLPDVWNEATVDRDRIERELGGRVRDIAQDEKADPNWMRRNVDSHVKRLSTWAQKKKKVHQPVLHTETTVIAPDLGLKGRIDALWFRDGERMALGELKSGSRRNEDELQLSSYGLMLVSRGEVGRDIRSMLMYSKPPWGDDEGVEKRVTLDQPRFREAVAARNKVLLIDSSTNAPVDERHCETCVKWGRSSTCALLAHLFGNADPRSRALRENLTEEEKAPLQHLGAAERRFFEEQQAKIQAELRATKSKHAWLWSRTPEQREREGLALRFQAVFPIDVSGPRHRYGLLVGANANHSQIQTENSVTLSGLEGPTQGRLVIATVVHTDSNGIEVECDEPLPFTEGWASAEIDDKLIEREFAALFQWIVNPSAVRDVVVHGRPPTLDPLPRAWKMPAADLNDQQKKAVKQSVQTRDYLLVLGPPGAGKTTLLLAMVKAHLALGRRVLVSANSNRALDQVVRTLLKGDLQNDVLRLGRLAGMSEDVRACALDSCYDTRAPLEAQVDAIREACASKRIVAATASSLAAGVFEPILGRFDLVIIDEATQVSLPLSLGPIRYADRFVLVGDPNQLAPIRMAVDRGSEPSLFEVLADRIRESGAEGLVQLSDQYRMNAEICRIPSDMWYEKALRPGTSAVADGRLAINVGKIAKGVRKLLDPKRPVVFLDVPSDFSHGPRMNVEEARRVADIVEALYAADPSLPAKVDDRLGVLAPYRAQVACIRRALSDRLPRDVDSRPWVDTVDRFQGGERDIMVISLVGARDGPVPEHLREYRRLNVALSRARHKLIVIGDHDFLARDRLFADLFAVMARVDAAYRLRPQDL